MQGQGCPTSSNSSRSFSIQPEDTVYGGPTAPLPKRVTLRTLQSKYRKKQPISMVTAYDYQVVSVIQGASQDCASLTLRKDLQACCYLCC